MGSLSIQKGKRAERDVASRLNEILRTVGNRLQVEHPRLARNLKQTQIGGFDLDGLDWIAIEIKHHKTVCLPAWWRQTLAQAGTTREPVLIWKPHGGKWNVRMFGRLEIEKGRRIKCVVDIDWDSFAMWFEKRAELEMQKSVAPPGIFD